MDGETRQPKGNKHHFQHRGRPTGGEGPACPVHLIQKSPQWDSWGRICRNMGQPAAGHFS